MAVQFEEQFKQMLLLMQVMYYKFLLMHFISKLTPIYNGVLADTQLSFILELAKQDNYFCDYIFFVIGHMLLKSTNFLVMHYWSLYFYRKKINCSKQSLVLYNLASFPFS